MEKQAIQKWEQFADVKLDVKQTNQVKGGTGIIVDEIIMD